MIVKPAAMERIRKIIEKHHKYLLLSMVGSKNVPPELKAELKRQGFDVDNARSILEVAYNHNYMNPHGAVNAPVSRDEMHAQQDAGPVPAREEHKTSADLLNSNLRNAVEKQKQNCIGRIEAILHAQNNEFKFAKLGLGGGERNLETQLMETSKSKLKTMLRDATHDGTRDWDRVVTTEVSNAISLGSADRIIEQNADVPASEIIVYRIVVNDAALCKYCRRFYLDRDNTPKLYRMASILANGTNFGKRAAEWKPVAGATHPRERCSQLIELRRGWKVLDGGRQAFMGLDGWDDYIAKKVVE